MVHIPNVRVLQYVANAISFLEVVALDSEIQTLRRTPSPAGERMVKAAAEACMMDLKASFPELLLSENAIQVNFQIC